MTPQNSLELQGKIDVFPLAEIFVEIAQSRLDGSLRIAHEAQKVIIYFRNGKLVFAVSNARSSRLFDILLRENKIDKKTLSEIPNFTSDFELSKALVEKNLFSENAINALFSAQIEGILRESLSWKTGEWAFNPLARIREGISFEINLPKLLFEYARNLPHETVLKRFRSLQETFSANSFSETTINLQPHEAYILSRFSDLPMNIEEIKLLGGLPDSATYQTLYSLWLGGFLTRKNWIFAFSERQIAHIKTANLTLVKKAETITEHQKDETDKTLQNAEAENILEIPEEEAEKEITLEEYLQNVEDATNHYEVLGVEIDSESSEIKKIYFNFAKRFHPDIFQRTADEKLFMRIQDAFAKIASAYETLRDKDLRELYDFRVRKELAQMKEKAEKHTDEKQPDLTDQTKMAFEQFEQGYNLLLEEHYAEAAPFLARAAHLDNQNARYRAFFGKVLQYDSKQRHKAENEIQTAIKLEPENELYRIIYAEFFIHYGLMKRAEGELKRLLAIAPNNLEAQNLLKELQNK